MTALTASASASAFSNASFTALTTHWYFSCSFWLFAYSINADEAATKEQVDAAYELLLSRVHLLGFIGNPTNLKVTLDLAKKTSTEGKTEESVAVLNAAIEKAEELLASGNALQEELDAMVAELKAAIEGLKDEAVVEVDKAKLLEMIKKAEGYDLTKYTPVSFSKSSKASLFGISLKAKIACCKG